VPLPPKKTRRLLLVVVLTVLACWLVFEYIRAPDPSAYGPELRLLHAVGAASVKAEPLPESPEAATPRITWECDLRASRMPECASPLPTLENRRHTFGGMGFFAESPGHLRFKGPWSISSFNRVTLRLAVHVGRHGTLTFLGHNGNVVLAEQDFPIRAGGQIHTYRIDVGAALEAIKGESEVESIVLTTSDAASVAFVVWLRLEHLSPEYTATVRLAEWRREHLTRAFAPGTPAGLETYRVGFGQDLRPCFTAFGETVWSFPLALPAFGRLGFALGYTNLTAEPVTVETAVELHGGLRRQRLWSREQKLGPRERSNAWQAVNIELPADGPRSGRLVLRTTIHRENPERSAVAVGWSHPVVHPGEVRRDQHRNVILVSLDTTRGDVFGANGDPSNVSPVVDELSRRCANFVNAFSQNRWTLPSHISMMTSLYPHQHRVISFSSPLVFERIPFLAEVFATAGHLTAGFVDGGFVSSEFGFARGMHRFFMDNQITANAGEDVGRAVSWLEEERAYPFFLFLHTYENHTPYLAPEEYQALFTDKTVPVDLPHPDKYFTSAFIRKHHLQDYVFTLYRAEIRYTDAALGGLFRAMDREELWENTLLIITSDHGEEFYEHNKLGHTQSFEETTRVPLFIHVPGGRNGLHEAFVELVDLYPTVLDFAGLPLPPHVRGRSLLPLLRGEAEGMKERPAFSESFSYDNFGQDGFSGIGFVKRVPDRSSHVDFAKGTWKHFDLTRDPGERKSLEAPGNPPQEELEREFLDRLFAMEGMVFAQVLNGPPEGTIEIMAHGEQVVSVAAYPTSRYRSHSFSRKEKLLTYTLAAGDHAGLLVYPHGDGNLSLYVRHDGQAADINGIFVGSEGRRPSGGIISNRSSDFPLTGKPLPHDQPGTPGEPLHTRACQNPREPASPKFDSLDREMVEKLRALGYLH
jgi:arylsulfatase A-like enzyme